MHQNRTGLLKQVSNRSVVNNILVAGYREASALILLINGSGNRFAFVRHLVKVGAAYDAFLVYCNLEQLRAVRLIARHERVHAERLHLPLEPGLGRRARSPRRNAASGS